MKVLAIGSDRQLFQADSDVCRRQIEYAKNLSRLDIIVFTKRVLSLCAAQIGSNIFVYPTNSASRWFYPFDAVRLGKRLSKPDLVTAQDPFESGWAAWRLAQRFDSKLELQIHTDIGSSYFRRHSILNLIRFWLAHFLLPRADHVRVVSNRIKNFLVTRWHLPENRIEVRPITVDAVAIKQAIPSVDLHQKYSEFQKIILMASRLEPEKNINLAIRAMRLVNQKLPEAGLLIVGSGSEEAKLRSLIFRLGLVDRVRLEPSVDQTTLISYYKTADLFLLTSLYEGYGLTLVEARAAGCPIVSTDVGVAREVGAWVVEMGPADVASGILESLR